MKRYCVEYNDEYEVEKIYQSRQTFLGRPSSVFGSVTQSFFCDAIDELGAMARFIEAREKYYG